jgi:hypothetical protein
MDKCRALKHNGDPCQNRSLPGLMYCGIHRVKSLSENRKGNKTKDRIDSHASTSIEMRRLELQEKQQVRESTLRARELRLKVMEVKKQLKWYLSPTTTTIIAAVFTLLGTAVGAILQGVNKVEIEKQKLESSIILKAIETGDSIESRTNLKFFARMKLINDDEGIIESLTENPEDIPVRPAARGSQNPRQITPSKGSAFMPFQLMLGKSLKSGDILLRQSSDPVSRLISTFIGGGYSHIGIAIREDDGWFVYEAAPRKQESDLAIRKSPLNKFLRMSKDTTYLRVKVLRSKFVIDIPRFKKALTDHKDYRFDYNFGATGESNVVYCTDFILKVFQSSGNRVSDPINYYPALRKIVEAIRKDLKRRGKSVEHLVALAGSRAGVPIENLTQFMTRVSTDNQGELYVPDSITWSSQFYTVLEREFGTSGLFDSGMVERYRKLSTTIEAIKNLNYPFKAENLIELDRFRGVIGVKRLEITRDRFNSILKEIGEIEEPSIVISKMVNKSLDRWARTIRARSIVGNMGPMPDLSHHLLQSSKE